MVAAHRRCWRRYGLVRRGDEPYRKEEAAAVWDVVVYGYSRNVFRELGLESFGLYCVFNHRVTYVVFIMNSKRYGCIVILFLRQRILYMLLPWT